jgi:hypothetical protein
MRLIRITTDILEAHSDKVRSVVPSTQLLEMELNDGWEPLCTFLGVSVPHEPFPRANDAKAADEYAKKVVLKALSIWLGILSVLGAIGYSGVLLWKSQLR